MPPRTGHAIHDVQEVVDDGSTRIPLDVLRHLEALDEVESPVQIERAAHVNSLKSLSRNQEPVAIDVMTIDTESTR